MADHYDDQYDEQAEEEQPQATDENTPLRQVPWFVISAAAHGVLFAILWGIVMSTHEQFIPQVQPAAVEPHELPDPPKIQPTQRLPEERVDDPVEKPTEDPRISENAKDDHNEDPTQQENQDTRPNPNPNDSNVESPFPNMGFNSSIGVGGNIGGGGGPSGAGGFLHRRARGGAGAPRGDDNVMAALRWLRDHQRTDGGWDPIKFDEDGRRAGRSGSYANKDGSGDKGWPAHEAGLTGLSLLAFLGAGYTHQDGEFQETVRRALRFLRAVQDNDGCFGSREDHHFVYDHSICAMAMAEAYGMTGSNMLKGPAQKGVDFIAMCQNHDPDRGWLGWRYGVKPGESDTSVTGWMALALKSARVANLEIPDRCWEGSLRLLDDMTGDSMGYPKTGYTSKGGHNARLQSQARFVPNPSMDAINIMTRMFVEENGNQVRRNPMIRSQAQQITMDENLPTLRDPNKLDYYYWYYASLAIFQVGDAYWTKWEKAMGDALIQSQRLDGDDKVATYGSWDSNDCWGIAGGRVYATAINCLTLEVYYRYEKIGAGK